MARRVSIPHGAWPLEMRAETAAAYVDEPSVEAFHAKVKRGVYSGPRSAPGELPKWHRTKLDHDIARRHGLAIAPQAIVENVEGLI